MRLMSSYVSRGALLTDRSPVLEDIRRQHQFMLWKLEQQPNEMVL